VGSGEQKCRGHIFRRGSASPHLRGGGAKRGTGLEQLQMPSGKLLALFD